MTVTSTVPAPPGLVAVIWVSESIVIVVADVTPNPTDVAPIKPLPVITTDVPPTVGPDAGAIAVTAGTVATYVN